MGKTSSICIIRWLQSVYPDSSRSPHILLWGHSLGTAIATRTLASLESQAEAGARVRGIVLESPFNKMEDEVKSFSAAQWTSWLLGIVSLELNNFKKFKKSFVSKFNASGHSREHQDG